MKVLRFFLFFLLIALYTGCTTSSSHNRGSLSDAMDEARDDNEGDREVPDENDEPSWWDDDKEEDDRRDRNDNYRREESQNTASLSSEPIDTALLIRGGYSFPSGPYFDSLSDGEILLGAGEKNVEIYLFAGYKSMETQKDHIVSQSIKNDVLILNVGIEFRYYPLWELNFFSPYLLARAGGMCLFWSFMNPLTSGDDTISSDIVGGMLLGAGAGVDLIHTDFFRLGAQVIPEIYLFGEETSQGFINDYFTAQGVVRWSLEGGFIF